MSLNSSQLRAFHTVAVHRQFTTAARALNVTQPTLSNQVAALELQFDVRLFDRSARGVTLTPVGERLFELTQQHFAIAEQAEQLLSASGTLAGGFVRIGADGPHHVMPVVAKFTQLYPELEVSLQMGNAGAVLQRLAEARLDVAIVGRKSPDTRFHFEVFRQSPIVCFAAIQHPLSQRDSVALTDIVKHKMILREPASETRQLFERALRAGRLTIGEHLQIESREAVREAVAENLGVGVVSLAELDPDPRLRVLPINDADMNMTEYIACMTDRRGLSVVEAFFDAARASNARDTPTS